MPSVRLAALLLALPLAIAGLPASAGPGVTLGGDGRMGLHFDGDDWNLTSRVRVTFTLQGRTDGGLTFGGTLRADRADAAARGAAGEVFVQGDFGRLALGDVDGAAELAVGNISGVGFTGLGETEETLFYADAIGAADGDPQAVWSFRRGGLLVSVSAFDGAGAVPGRGIPGHVARARGFGVGAAWSGRAWGETVRLGLGYERMEAGGRTAEQLILGGEVTIRGATVRGIYGREFGPFPEVTQYGISVDYTLRQALTLTVFSRKNDYESLPALHWYGFGASWDLGGGAQVKGGVVIDRTLGRDDAVLADVGVVLNF